MEDGGNRKFILAQLPEPTGRKDFPTIAEITKERVRRVIRRIEQQRGGQLELSAGAPAVDLGFKVFKLASSNFSVWDPALAPTQPDELAQQWQLTADNVRADAHEQALLYELMLKCGLPLSSAVETADAAGCTVYRLDEGRLAICLSRAVTPDALRAMRPGARTGHAPPLPDIVGYLQRETELTRSTIVEILIASGRMAEALKNPQQFMEQAAGAILHAKRELMVDGIRYERVDGQTYEMQLFENDEIESYLSRLLPVAHSVYDAIEYDSEVERKFAEALDANEDVRLFVKLPRWFLVKTPLGDYRPDWALVRESDGRVYLVVETKGTTDRKALPDAERLRIKCGERHFENCLNVPYKLAKSVEDIV